MFVQRPESGRESCPGPADNFREDVTSFCMGEAGQKAAEKKVLCRTSKRDGLFSSPEKEGGGRGQGFLLGKELNVGEGGTMEAVTADEEKEGRRGGRAVEKMFARTRVIITPAPGEQLMENDIAVDADPLSKKQRHKVPQKIEDITKDWLLFVMRQHHHTFGRRLSNVGLFSVEMDGIRETSETSGVDPIDRAIVTKIPTSSQHILSDAFRVIVEVPDPPESELAEEDEEEEEGLEKPNSSCEEEDEEERNKEQAERKKVIETAAKSAVKSLNRPANIKTHYLFVKVPPKHSARFERMVKRNRTLEHEVKVYTDLIRDLKTFVSDRVGKTVTLNIPTLYHGFTANNDQGPNGDRSVLVIEDLARRGFATKDWFKAKLGHEEVLLSLKELAKFHACGLAYRMSLKEEIVAKYPYLDDDLYTSNMSKELLAKYLDSYLHFLSFLPGIGEHVHKLRKISEDVFQLLIKLRRPTDTLGTRFNTICHGDMWMGNLMFSRKDQPAPAENGGTKNGTADGVTPDGASSSSLEPPPKECFLIDFHSAQFLSPATDLAHLLLTSTTREYRKQHWDEVVQHYYNIFNRTLAEFGLVLRHLGTTYNDFLYEVKRALRGQFLCVAFIIPIVIYCGPTEWRFERRRGSSIDRKNTVRHLIQMMAITEEGSPSPMGASTREERGVPPASTILNSLKGQAKEKDELNSIPPEFEALYNDLELRQNLVDLIESANDLDILDFHEFCRHINNPKPMWSKTQATTGKHIPVY